MVCVCVTAKAKGTNSSHKKKSIGIGRKVKVHGMSHLLGAFQRKLVAQIPYFSTESNADKVRGKPAKRQCVYQWAVLPGPIKGDVLTIDCHIPVALISVLCDSISARRPGRLPDRQGGAERQ